jgi:site-specific DNA-methyltransferase (adenine-specific)
MTRWTVHQADVLEALRAMPDNSFDAMLSDPPAGISFMNKSWDSDRGGRDEWVAWLASVMRECLRVLRPGAYMLVWAIPRTSHWTATAIENAGAEVRDVITHHFGSGFPKSLSVDKAIDAHLGDERPVHGVQVRSQAPSGIVSAGRESTTIERRLTSAASAASAAFSGYGTATKPATEHWILARKPLEGTYAENALKWGTGGLAIDACRIGYADDADHAAMAAGVEAIRSRGGVIEGSWKNCSDLSGANPANALGRWPANLVLSHSPDCNPIGTKTAKGHKGYPTGRGGTTPLYMGEADPRFRRKPQAGVADREEVDYECAPGCPVAILDAQSGDRPGMSGGGKHREDYEGGMFGSIDAEHLARNDNGGASRFFYVAKASRAEREFGCEALPLKSAAEMTDSEEGQARLDSPRSGAGRTSGARNHHPTVKSVALAKWLASLIKPPRRDQPLRCLNPFAGSGTEAIGALRAGFDETVSIERDPEYVAIADARLTRWDEVPAHMEPDEVKPAKVDPAQTSLFGSKQ